MEDVFSREKEKEGGREEEEAEAVTCTCAKIKNAGTKGGRNKGSLMRTKKGTSKAKGVFMRVDFRAHLSYDQLLSIC